MAVPPAPAPMRRFLIGFPICLVVGYALMQVPAFTDQIAVLTGSLVTVCSALIRLCGGHAVADGRILQSPAGFSVLVANGCDGVNVTILLWAAILSYPAPWRLKWRGLAAGTVALHGINLLRIISLFYLGQYDPAWFEFAHLYLWESLIVLDTLAIFWYWATRVRQAEIPRHAARA